MVRRVLLPIHNQYHEGKRNRHRIVWSNDGLIFVTYDHYATFYVIG
ncbi:MAG: hypothetical protein SPF51_06365 [Candidatus Fimivicinus sp.]|nr:hypothetical protein [Oscillospiraceae bacterium]MDY5591156.1 hypothetical protein [Candidatus Fimivicinus sp.]